MTDVASVLLAAAADDDMSDSDDDDEDLDLFGELTEEEKEAKAKKDAVSLPLDVKTCTLEALHNLSCHTQHTSLVACADILKQFELVPPYCDTGLFIVRVFDLKLHRGGYIPLCC